MKKIALLWSVIVCIAFAAVQASAAAVSYIIPDIGSPGMNIYTEIIGPENSFDNFGPDRVVREPYKDPALKIEFWRTGDSLKITFGALSVSWGGRMISTQIFVNPFMTMPSTSYWNRLDTDNIIQFRVITGGNVSDWQKFYIVKPFNFENLSSTENVFGAGNLGIRSPRGAMIVDSLKLANITYTVSISDCDPETDGNQGYLPFILLSRGDITGPAVIDVSGDGKNAGCGGGGGGGNFCDSPYADSSQNGGSGFVGGGRGGLHAAATGSNLRKSWGDATGFQGASINGVAAPADNSFESAGGGTGHPFGVSGKSATIKDNVTDPYSVWEANNSGGYGGGSGAAQQSKGGSGGFSSVGFNTIPVDKNISNSGRINGNPMIVPIAGGSGGASGNPYSSSGNGDCSGCGGGGGGAIRIFARNLTNVTIKSDGADGGFGSSTTYGGGGSGGSIGVFVKHNADQIRTQVYGGLTGNIGDTAVYGLGRTRFDITYPGKEIVSNPDQNGVNHVGFTTDTTFFIQGGTVIRGSKAVNDSIALYIKGLHGSTWKYVAGFGRTRTFWSWFLTEPFFSDSLYYFYAERINSSSGHSDSCQYIPAAEYSQAAANIFKIVPIPLLTITSSTIKRDTVCAGQIISDSIPLQCNNWIDFNLELTTDGNGFSANLDKTTIHQRNDSVKIYYRFNSTGLADGLYSANFTIHSDNYKKDFTFTKEIYVWHSGLTVADCDFGQVSVGEAKDTVVTVYNTGTSPLEIKNLPVAESPFLVLSSTPALPAVIPVGGSIRLSVVFQPISQGDAEGKLVISIPESAGNCSAEAEAKLTGYGLKAQVELSRYNIHFNTLWICSSQNDTVTMKNTGEISVTIDSVFFTGQNPQRFSIAYPKLSVTLAPGDTVRFNLTYTPEAKKYGRDTAVINFVGSGTFPTAQLSALVEEAKFKAEPGPYNINLGRIPVGSSKDVKEMFTLGTEYIPELWAFEERPDTITTDKPAVSMSQTKDVLLLDWTKDSVIVTVHALKYGWDTVVIYFRDVFCKDSLDSLTFVYYGTGKQEINVDRDYGILTPCDVINDTVNIVNDCEAGNTMTVKNIWLTGEDSWLIYLKNTYKFPFEISPGDTLKIPITFDPKAASDGVKHAIVNCRYTNCMGDEVYYTYTITAEKRIGTAMPGLFVFDTTLVGDTAKHTFTINNTSGYELKVDSIRIFRDREFTTIPANIDGIIIPKDDSLHFEAVFAPTDQIDYKDTMIVSYTVNNCAQWAGTVLEGSGLKKNSVLHIELPDITNANPAAANLDIPITAWIEDGGTLDSLADAEIDFDLFYNTLLYYPKKLTPAGSIISPDPDLGTGTKFTLLHSLITKEKKVIGTISGVPILGDTAYTALKIENPKIDGSKFGYVLIIKKDGSISYKICTSGGERLLTNTDINAIRVKISPNPPTDEMRIEISTLEIGNHTLTISDEAGRILYSQEWTAEKNSETKEFDLQTANYGCGTYFVKVKSPNGSAAAKFQKIK